MLKIISLGTFLGVILDQEYLLYLYIYDVIKYLATTEYWYWTFKLLSAFQMLHIYKTRIANTDLAKYLLLLVMKLPPKSKVVYTPPVNMKMQ